VALVGEILFASLWLRSSLSRGADASVTRYVVATMAITSRGVALPASQINLVTGILLIFLGPTHFSHALWLWVSIALYTIMAGMWHGTLIPLRKKMESVLEGSGTSEYGPMARRWVSVSRTVLILFALILVLMIWKPTI